MEAQAIHTGHDRGPVGRACEHAETLLEDGVLSPLEEIPTLKEVGQGNIQVGNGELPAI